MKKNDEIEVKPNKLETMEDKKVVAITDDELNGVVRCEITAPFMYQLSDVVSPSFRDFH